MQKDKEVIDLYLAWYFIPTCQGRTTYQLKKEHVSH